MSFHDILWTVQKKLSSFRKQEEKQNWKKIHKDYIHVSTTPHPRIIIERLCTLQNYVFMCVLYDNRLLKIFFTWKKKQRCFSNDSMHVLFFFFCQCNRLCNFHKKKISVTKYICKVLLFGVCKTSHLIHT